MRKFLYEPYGDNGAAILLYFHQKPTEKYDDFDMIGVDVPVKEDPEWRFWRSVHNDEFGIDDIEPDLTEGEKEQIKKYILEHRELVPNIFCRDVDFQKEKG